MKTNSSKHFLLIVAVLCLSFDHTHAQSFLTNGLVAYYPFNGNANDESGNGFDGIASSNCWFVPDRFSNVNYALFISNNQSLAELDSGRVDVAAATINSLTAGTISAWINPADVTSGDIVAKQHSGNNSYAIFSIGGYADGGGQPAFGTPGILYFRSQDSAPIAASTVVVTNQTWQQVVVVFTEDSCSFYINGVLCGTNAGDYSIPNDLNADSTSIGCWHGDGFLGSQRLRFIGSMDDVRVYNRALLASEIKQLYQIESSQSRQNPKINLGKAISVQLDNLNVGYNYQLQTSTDGRHWADFGSPFTALTKNMTYGYWDTGDYNHLFFRVNQIF